MISAKFVENLSVQFTLNHLNLLFLYSHRMEDEIRKLEELFDAEIKAQGLETELLEIDNRLQRFVV